jgi:hypothetical protein
MKKGFLVGSLPAVSLPSASSHDMVAGSKSPSELLVRVISQPSAIFMLMFLTGPRSAHGRRWICRTG